MKYLIVKYFAVHPNENQLKWKKKKKSKTIKIIDTTRSSNPRRYVWINASRLIEFSDAGGLYNFAQDYIFYFFLWIFEVPINYEFSSVLQDLVTSTNLYVDILSYIYPFDLIYLLRKRIHWWIRTKFRRKKKIIMIFPQTRLVL